MTTYLQTHEDTPILSLVMSDLKSKLNITEASLEYFPIIQNRIDQLEEPDNPDEHEQAVQEYIDHESSKASVTREDGSVQAR